MMEDRKIFQLFSAFQVLNSFGMDLEEFWAQKTANQNANSIEGGNPKKDGMLKQKGCDQQLGIIENARPTQPSLVVDRDGSIKNTDFATPADATSQ